MARVPGLSCGVVCVILSAILIQHQLVTDRRTDINTCDQSSRGKNQDGLLGWIWPGNNFSGLGWVGLGFKQLNKSMGIARRLSVNWTVLPVTNEGFKRHHFLRGIISQCATKGTKKLRARCTRLTKPELSKGPFCVTRSNPAHQLTDPIKHKWENLHPT